MHYVLVRRVASICAESVVAVLATNVQESTLCVDDAQQSAAQQRKGVKQDLRHQSGISLTLIMRLMSMTGFLSTPHLKAEGYWPTRLPVRKPPCDPPITATLSLSTSPIA